MALFKIDGSVVTKIVAKELDLEKYLQRLFEQNLRELLNIVFLAHEYTTSFGGRIDTLGIDRNGSPCIIEYKKNQNDNVINQGLSYLRWLLDHKADFEILCRNKKIDVEIDWDTPRVICIAESYNKFDLDTADILPMNIELLRYCIYGENLLYLEPESYQKVKVATAKIVKKSRDKKAKEMQLQKVYSLDDHLTDIKKEAIDLFQDLRSKILSLDQNIIEEAKAKYIAYKTTTNFVDIVVKQYGVKIFLNVKSGQLNDPQKLARDLTKPKPIGHWGNGDYEIKIKSVENANAVFALIKQSYNLNK
ncbi:MAG: transporter [Candidatus Omnitrophica bacterium]|nr:transporter [Candidatus Omnitrophota bacterium]